MMKSMGFLRDWYCCSNKLTPMGQTWLLVIEIPMKNLVRVLAYFLFLMQKVVLKAKGTKIVNLQLLIKHNRRGV